MDRFVYRHTPLNNSIYEIGECDEPRSCPEYWCDRRVCEGFWGDENTCKVVVRLMNKEANRIRGMI